MLNAMIDPRKVDFKNENKWLVPVGVSNRHVHLSQKDIDTLFGKNYELTVAKELAQAGQFAARETVNVVGSKGVIERARIVGPSREDTQVELSRTDAVKIGIEAPIRDSGDLEGTPGLVLVGPKGPIIINRGCIIPSAHIHISRKKAEQLDINNGDKVSVLIKGVKVVCYHNILVRCTETGETEFHIDTDEANAGFVDTGDLAMIKHKEMVVKDSFGNIVEVGVDNIKFVRGRNPSEPHTAEAIRLMTDVFRYPVATQSIISKLLRPGRLEQNQYYMLIAMEGEKVVGLACFYYLPEPKLGYLEHIGIVPEYRNRSIGSFLYHKVVAFLEKENPDIEGMLLEVPLGRDEMNVRKQFYLNLGAIPVDTAFYPSTELTDTRYFMFKPLVTNANLNTITLERALNSLSRVL